MADNEQTAKQRYEFNRDNVKLRIKVLQEWMEADQREFDKDQGNWGHVGTMSNISTSLGDILDSFGLDPLRK